MAKSTNGTTAISKDIDLSALDNLDTPQVLPEITVSAQDIKESSKVDYQVLKKMMENDAILVAVTNDSNQPLVQDWNLELLPEDINDAFNKYLQEKYVQYEIQEIVKDSRIVSVYIDGKTVNFLDSFLAEKRVPVLLSRQRGKEKELRSSFAINAGATIIMTRKQADALSKFEKVKRTWETAKGEKRETPWLGFLKMKTIGDSKELFKYDISYVTLADLTKSAEDVKEGKAVYTRRQAGIIREEE